MSYCDEMWMMKRVQTVCLQSVVNFSNGFSLTRKKGPSANVFSQTWLQITHKSTCTHANTTTTTNPSNRMVGDILFQVRSCVCLSACFISQYVWPQSLTLHITFDPYREKYSYSECILVFLGPNTFKVKVTSMLTTLWPWHCYSEQVIRGHVNLTWAHFVLSRTYPVRIHLQ